MEIFRYEFCWIRFFFFSFACITQGGKCPEFRWLKSSKPEKGLALLGHVLLPALASICFLGANSGLTFMLNTSKSSIYKSPYDTSFIYLPGLLSVGPWRIWGMHFCSSNLDNESSNLTYPAWFRPVGRLHLLLFGDGQESCSFGRRTYGSQAWSLQMKSESQHLSSIPRPFQFSTNHVSGCH